MDSWLTEKNTDAACNNKINIYLSGIGVVHVVLLTCVDCMDLITKGDLIDIYKCMPVKLKVMNAVICKHIFGMSL